MLFYFLIVLSIWFNYIWLVNNESFILGVFLLMFFLIIYIFLSLSIKIYFFSNVSNVLNLLRYSNLINLHLDKVIYYNIIVKNSFLRNLILKKHKIIHILYYLNKKINKFLFFNILNIFLILKKNLCKILKNKNFVFLLNKTKKCEVII